MRETMQVALTNEQVGYFQERGFLSLGCLTTEEELTWLCRVYDEIVEQKTGCAPAKLAKVIHRNGPPPLVTILSPEAVVPALTNTLFLRNARKVVARLLAVEETRLINGWRIFCKPARAGETHWHQDAAYRPPPYHGASVWMSLDPATVESSCLSYLRGSHLGEVRPHHFRHDHLTVDDVDFSQAEPCPVSAGEATVHHCRTLHYAGPNKTERPRRALVVVCQATANCQKMAENPETKK